MALHLMKPRRHPWTPADVLAIYRAYPRHVGRKAAEKAIQKALCEAHAAGVEDPVAYVLESTRAFAESPAGQKGQYTPHPATWFNRASYEDDQAEWGHRKPPEALGYHEMLSQWYNAGKPGGRVDAVYAPTGSRGADGRPTWAKKDTG